METEVENTVSFWTATCWHVPFVSCAQSTVRRNMCLMECVVTVTMLLAFWYTIQVSCVQNLYSFFFQIAHVCIFSTLLHD